MQFKCQHAFYININVSCKVLKLSCTPWLLVNRSIYYWPWHKPHSLNYRNTDMHVCGLTRRQDNCRARREALIPQPPPPRQGNRGESPWPHLFVIGLIQGKIPEPRPCLMVHDGSRLHKHVGTYGIHVQCMFACTSMSYHRDVSGYKILNFRANPYRNIKRYYP